MTAPAVGWLTVASLVPLVMTLWYSVHDVHLLEPSAGFVGARNYVTFLQDPDFVRAIVNTVMLIVGVLAIDIVLGIALALLLASDIRGVSVLRLLVISPFFVMPTVTALLWKNLLLNPVSGVVAALLHGVGLPPIDFVGRLPLGTIVIMLSWSWLPLGTLVFLTTLQSIGQDQFEAATLDRAGALARFRHVLLPYLFRPIAFVVLIETIALIAVFAEIFVTTAGGPGNATTTLSFLVFAEALLRFDIGAAAAAGIVVVLFANLLFAAFARLAGRRLEQRQ
ncbi:carbohydrate ABC transporter permease [Sphingomonas bacterium]|uniref:carbohydrate ABC transporter permease n=1 Tax=Sphingomonas bacterium TaxID=1895847 RepID=UPI0015751719|nr:sugar ABC transporter permease [Sphingomonas bacterium]